MFAVDRDGQAFVDVGSTDRFVECILGNRVRMTIEKLDVLETTNPLFVLGKWMPRLGRW
jgi:hypothetical protein